MAIPINGPIVSTFICILCAAFAFFDDTIHVIFPVLESRRHHTSTLYHLFGPLVGVNSMDKFHAALTSLMLLPILAGIWQKSMVWSLITVTLLATLQPYYLLVAVFRKTCNLQKAIYPAVYSAIFGVFGLLWRLANPQSSTLSKYDVPVVAIWYVFITSVVVFYVFRVQRNASELTASIELEHLKHDTYMRGECTWPNAKEIPEYKENFEPYPILIETAEVEQEKLTSTKAKKVVSLMFLLSALFMFGTSASENHREYISDRVIMLFFTGMIVPLVLLQVLFVFYFLHQPLRSQQQMFDDIEGSRSFDSQQQSVV